MSGKYPYPPLEMFGQARESEMNQISDQELEKLLMQWQKARREQPSEPVPTWVYALVAINAAILTVGTVTRML